MMHFCVEDLLKKIVLCDQLCAQTALQPTDLEGCKMSKTDLQRSNHTTSNTQSIEIASFCPCTISSSCLHIIDTFPPNLLLHLTKQKRNWLPSPARTSKTRTRTRTTSTGTRMTGRKTGSAAAAVLPLSWQRHKSRELDCRIPILPDLYNEPNAPLSWRSKCTVLTSYCFPNCGPVLTFANLNKLVCSNWRTRCLKMH